FRWLKDLFLLGLNKDLTQEDLYNTLPEDVSEKLGDKMERLWKKNMAANEKKSKKASLLHVIIKMFFWQFMMYGILTFIVSCVFR
ncbi:unnamed protein product, partial [Timema podura]|nr:unnamed protein product [Timema podura]